jgi:hypothetical protein
MEKAIVWPREFIEEPDPGRSVPYHGRVHPNRPLDGPLRTRAEADAFGANKHRVFEGNSTRIEAGWRRWVPFTAQAAARRWIRR